MIKPEVLDALVAAGCTAEQIAAAVKADQAGSSGAARQAKYRAKKASQSDERDVTSVTVTAAVSPKKETSPAPLKEKTTPSSEPNGSSKKPTRLPVDFAFPAEWRQWAINAGLPTARCDTEFTKLTNWAANAPGSKGAKRDWFKAWQNWALKAIDELPNARGSPHRSQQPRGSDFFDIEAERLRNERPGNGRGDQGDWDDAPGVPLIAIDYHG